MKKIHTHIRAQGLGVVMAVLALVTKLACSLKEVLANGLGDRMLVLALGAKLACSLKEVLANGSGVSSTCGALIRVAGACHSDVLGTKLPKQLCDEVIKGPRLCRGRLCLGRLRRTRSLCCQKLIRLCQGIECLRRTSCLVRVRLEGALVEGLLELGICGRCPRGESKMAERCGASGGRRHV
jgi:hypothetical protein